MSLALDSKCKCQWQCFTSCPQLFRLAGLRPGSSPHGTSIYAQQLAGSMCLSGSAEVAAARGQDADG